MNFFDRLDNLMKLAGVTNSKMARALHVDPSLVSRWRNGSRRPTRNSAQMVDIAAYLSAHIITEQHRALLSALLGDPTLKADSQEELTDVIYRWLNTDGRYPRLLPTVADLMIEVERESEGELIACNVFSGWMGRKLVLERLHQRFLARQDQKHHIRFYSNDPVEWLRMDIENRKPMVDAQPDLYQNVETVSAIVNNTVTQEEIMMLINFLSPFLHSGVLRILRAPRFGNGLFSNTIMIVGDTVAAGSSGFFGSSNFMTSLYTEPSFVRKLALDFDQQFYQCEPIHTVEENLTIWDSLQASVLMCMEDYVIRYAGNVLPRIFISSAILRELLTKGSLIEGTREEEVRLRQYGKCLDDYLLRQQFYIQIPLFSAEEVQNGVVSMIGVPRMIDGAPSVDLVLYVRMLKELCQKIKAYPNIIFSPMTPMKYKHCVYIQQGRQVLVSREREPFIGYRSTNATLVGALEAFIGERYGKLQAIISKREKSLEKLEAHIAWLEESL